MRRVLTLFVFLPLLFAFSCDDHYSLFSLSFTVVPDKATYEPSETAHFSVYLHNTFPTSFPDVVVRPQILDEKHNIVAELSPSLPLFVPAHNTTKLMIEWTVPPLPSGTYRIRPFAYSSGAQLSGVASLPGLYAGEGTFSIVSNVSTFAYFDRERVFLNNRPYNFTNTFENPVFKEKQAITLSTTLLNSGKRNGTLSFRLYYWEDIKHHALMSLCALSSGGYDFCFPVVQAQSFWYDTKRTFSDNETLTFRIANLSSGIYVAIITATFDDGQSATLRVRIPIAGKRRALLAFSGFIQYPFSTNSGEAFACYGYITSESMEPSLEPKFLRGNASLLFITSPFEKERRMYVIDTNISDTMQGVSYPLEFSSNESFSYIVVLSSNNETMDAMLVSYPQPEVTSSSSPVTVREVISGGELLLRVSYSFFDVNASPIALPCTFIVFNQNESAVASSSFYAPTFDANYTLPSGLYTTLLECTPYNISISKKITVAAPPQPPLQTQDIAIALFILLLAAIALVVALVSLYRIWKNITREEELQREEARLRDLLFRRRRDF